MIAPPQRFAAEIEVARRLARKAGARILNHYNGEFEVEYKDAEATDPVTQADKDANQIIVDGLRQAFPDDAILAEESADSAERLGKERLWCVDPLDGTREYVDKNGQFVVMIGLAIGGEAKLGVIYQPTEDILWWGVNSTAVEERSGDEAVRLRVSPTNSGGKHATMMVSRSHRSETVTRVALALGATEMPLGSVGLKISRIGMGAADIYLSVTDKTKEWDCCAPEALVNAAGGRMTDIRGEPLRYNKETPNTPWGLLATNRVLHESCLDALEPVVKDRDAA